MFEWLDTAIFTLSGVTITRLWPLAALASLLIAWAAKRKRYSAFAWFAAGLGGAIAASEIVRALVPKQGEVPDAAYIIWSNPGFRSDFGLLLILIGLAIALVQIIRRLVVFAGDPPRDASGQLQAPASPAQVRLSAAVGGFVLLTPVILWLWSIVRFIVIGEYSDLIPPLIIFVALAAAAGLLAAYLEDWKRTLALAILVAAALLGVMRWNATRPPGSMFESNGSFPAFLALIPIVFGLWVAQILSSTLPRRQYALLTWRLGGMAWALALIGWLVRFLGFYDYQTAPAFDLGSLFGMPVLIAPAVAGLYYDLVPRQIADGRNAANMEKWEAALVVLAGFGAWLWVLVQIQWRLGVRRARRTLGDYIERLSGAHLSLQQRRYVLAFALIAPAVALRTFTTFYPFLQTVALSVQKYNPAFPPRQYIGLRNFERLANDLVVRESLEFTVIFVFASTFFQMALGLAIAHLLNANFSLRALSRTISLIPWAIPMVVAAIGFRWMFDDQFGMIPDLLRRLFGYNGKWLVNPDNARIAITFVNTWKSTPFAALLLLAGLQGISQDLYEAAKVDGANWLDALRFITVPMLMPIIVTTTMFLLVWQLAVFDLPFAMTGGGPGFSTTVVAQKIYLEINSLNYSYAAAVSIALVIVVGVIGGLGLYALRRVEVSG